jgi:ubiquinone/menaquinone biosynthesis C-methylase UbiE
VARICDYENSRYRYDFWEGQGRQYEHLVEHIALRAMLPPSGDSLIDVGAGYGRLAPLYSNYRRVVLLDYARSQLEEARRFLPDLERHTLVVGDVYKLPFVDSSFDTVTIVRVMHHLADVPHALGELHRIVRPQGVMVLEHANKRHWKSVARWLLRRQTWNPFDPDPVEFVDLNFDFHPAWVRRQLVAAGFTIEAIRAVSLFRSAILKRLVPARWLAALDGLVQPSGEWTQFTPSVFVRAQAQKTLTGPSTGFLCCPECRCDQLITSDMTLDCAQCGRRWSAAGGIYDFRTPLNAS